MVFKPEDDDFYAKVKYGLELAIHRLYEKKAANNETAVFIIDGEVRHIPARELLENEKKGIWLNQTTKH